MEVNEIKIEEIPIASIMLYPKRTVKANITNNPPPIPKSPDIIPMDIPIQAVFINENFNFASFSSLFIVKKL